MILGWHSCVSIFISLLILLYLTKIDVVGDGDTWFEYFEDRQGFLLLINYSNCFIDIGVFSPPYLLDDFVMLHFFIASVRR